MYVNNSALKLSMTNKSKTWYAKSGNNLSITHSFSSHYAV